MNAWVLERAGPRAQALQAELSECEAAIAVARAGAEVERLHLLAPQRVELGIELTALLRPIRERHRADLRALFFSRVGNTTSTQTYRLRCQAVEAGLGWATATEVLDSALLAWKKSLALGRAPKFTNADRKEQDTLTLQFTLKGGLPVEQVLDGSSQEIHLTPADAARRRAYGAFRFRLGLARDGVNATGTWQHHRPIPQGAHVACARLVRRSVADKDRWSLQLVLRLAEPIRIDHTPLTDLAAVHFGWTRCEGGRRVATVARSADPGAAQPVVLPASIEGDLHHSAELQGRRALARDALLPHLATLANAKRQLPPGQRAELETLAKLPVNHVAFGRIYRLHKALAGIGLWRDWFDAWIRDDRMHWQAAVLLARRARGRPWAPPRLLSLHGIADCPRSQGGGHGAFGPARGQQGRRRGQRTVGSFFSARTRRSGCGGVARVRARTSVGLCAARHAGLRAEGHDDTNLRHLRRHRPGRGAGCPTASAVRPLWR